MSWWALSAKAEHGAAQPGRRRGPWRLLLGLGAAGIVVVAGGLLGYWIFMNLHFSLMLRDQPIVITLPEHLEPHVRVTEELEILMDGVISAQVPFRQEVSFPLRGSYNTEVELDAQVPVQFEVVYDGIIPVDTVAEIETRADFNYQQAKTLRNLHIQARLPMQFSMPVRLTAPVDQEIRFRYSGPLRMHFDQMITTEVDTVIDTALKVHQKVTAPVLAEIPMVATSAPRPMRAVIVETRISDAVRNIKLEQAEDTDRPQRAGTVWGPAEAPPRERAVTRPPAER